MVSLESACCERIEAPFLSQQSEEEALEHPRDGMIKKGKEPTESTKKSVMVSLESACYERIKAPFWYAAFGDSKLMVDVENHSFNATQLCLSGGKKLKHWLKNKRTRRWVESYRQEGSDRPTFQTVRGPKSKKDSEAVAGTYLPNEMLPGLALWISVDFYERALKMLETCWRNPSAGRNLEAILEGELADRAQTKLDGILRELDLKTKELDEKTKELAIRKRQLEDDETEGPNKKRKQDGAPSPLNMLAIVAKNDGESSHPYYAIRCRTRIYNKTLAGLRKRYPNSTVVLEKRYHANAANFFNLMKGYMSYIGTKGNHMSIEEGQLEKFKSDLDRLLLILL